MSSSLAGGLWRIPGATGREMSLWEGVSLRPRARNVTVGDRDRELMGGHGRIAPGPPPVSLLEGRPGLWDANVGGREGGKEEMRAQSVVTLCRTDPRPDSSLLEEPAAGLLLAVDFLFID